MDKGDTEGTKNLRVNAMTFNCDLDLESEFLSHGSAYHLTEMNI